MVPEDLCSGAEVRELGGGLTREDFRCPPFKRFDAVREEPGEFPLLIVERETVAVMKRFVRADHDGAGIDFLHGADDVFRGGQEAVIDALLSGRDALAIMPTGAGKSVCYQIPALLLSGITLVVSPLVSLMRDQVTQLVQMGIPAAFLNSSLTFRQYLLALDRARAGRYKIIYVAPERLETEGFQAFAREADISLVAVDEAHCISQWGQDFRPSYLNIPAFVESLPHRPPVGAFTATATPDVKADIRRLLDLRDPLELTTGFDRENLYFEVQQPADKRAALLELVKGRPGKCGIVYCATRKNVEEVCDFLRQRGVAAARYHAGLAPEERQRNQEDFLYDRVQVMVATNAFGMGIDEHDKLVEAGYDLAEIGAKLADNYVRQIMEDGFFHADPHPGNIRIRDGKIVWLDMGMMGSLNEKERKLIGNAIVGVARGDIALVRDAVLGLGEFHGTADKKQLYRDIEAMLDKYGSADLGTMDLAEVFEDMTSVMKTNGIAMPSSLTMLARGLATIEGVVADLSPELNIMNVITARIGDQMFDNVDWRALLTQDARAIYESSRKSLEIPALLADILRTGLKGEANLGVEHHAGEDIRKLVIAMVRKLCLMLLSLGLLIFGGAVAGNGPQVFGLSIYSSGCFVLALCAAGFALWNKKK